MQAGFVLQIMKKSTINVKGVLFLYFYCLAQAVRTHCVKKSHYCLVPKINAKSAKKNTNSTKKVHRLKTAFHKNAVRFIATRHKNIVRP